MTTRKPKLLPCPLPECGKPAKVSPCIASDHTTIGCWPDRGEPLTHELFCEGSSEQEAAARWNSLPRTKRRSPSRRR